MSTLRSDWPAAPNFHPEFGFLCPSPQARRRMRLALVGAMTGMVIGAAMELAVAHRNDADAGVSIPEADSIDAQPPTSMTAFPEVTGVPKVSARALERAGNTVEAAVASPPGGCRDAAAKDAAASFIGPTCRSRKPHVRHAARTGNRVATVIVGSVGAPVAPIEAEPVPTTVAALEPTQASVGATAKSIQTAQLTVGRATPAPKKRRAPGVRLAHLDSAGIDAYAAAPWSGRVDRSRHAAHAAAPQFNYAGPFGGIR
jgi:hypothetical protein